MKIKKAHIDGFGKWHDQDFDFTANPQIIYGPNEAGKTTLHTAIKTIFYPLTARSKENQEKICFIPIEPVFINKKETFIQELKSYVTKNKR